MTGEHGSQQPMRVRLHTPWLLRLALHFRRERDEARAERDELRSRLAHYVGEHPHGEDFGGATE